jgi:hypothetical protein
MCADWSFPGSRSGSMEKRILHKICVAAHLLDPVALSRVSGTGKADQDGIGFWAAPSFWEVCVRAVLPGHPGDAAYPGRLVTVLADRLA